MLIWKLSIKKIVEIYSLSATLPLLCERRADCRASIARIVSLSVLVVEVLLLSLDSDSATSIVARATAPIFMIVLRMSVISLIVEFAINEKW